MYEMTEQHWHTKYTHRGNAIQNKHKYITTQHTDREEEGERDEHIHKQTNKQTQMGKFSQSLTHSASLSFRDSQRDSSNHNQNKKKRIIDCRIYIHAASGEWAAKQRLFLNTIWFFSATTITCRLILIKLISKMKYMYLTLAQTGTRSLGKLKWSSLSKTGCHKRHKLHKTSSKYEV